MVAARKENGHRLASLRSIGKPEARPVDHDDEWAAHQVIVARYQKTLAHTRMLLELHQAAIGRMESKYRITDHELLFQLQLLDIRPIPTHKLKTIKDAGYVYIIQSKENGMCKIGMSKDFENRARQFNVKLPFKWHTVCVFAFRDYKAKEARFHEAFKEWRGNGEWFKLGIAHLSIALRTSGALERYFGEFRVPGTNRVYTTDLPVSLDGAIVLPD